MPRMAVLCIGVLLCGVCLCPGRLAAEDEKTVAIQDAPVAVRQAIARLFPAATIPVIEMELRDGKPVYEVEVKAKGTTTIVKLDDQGRLLKTRIKKSTDGDDDAGH